jgi:prepilin-type processing-associated H-X9-DG protein
MRTSRMIGCGGLGFLLLLGLSCLGLAVPLVFLFAVAFGWIFYLYRVLPQLTVSPAGVVTAVMCLAGVGFGAHAFLRWLHGAVCGPGSAPWRKKWSAQLVAGVLLMFVAGIGMIGVVHQTGWLITSPEPWVTSSDRRLLRRIRSSNNLKQIGLGAHGYHAAEKVFPPGAAMGAHGTLLHSWQTLILPYVEQGELSNRIDRTLPWDDPANAAALQTRVSFYEIPDGPPPLDASGQALTHYEGNARVVGRTKGLRAEDVTDGTSNTILAGESAGGYRPWAEPGHWRDPADGINVAPDRGFGSLSPGGASVLFLDGSVRFIKNTINPTVLKALSTPAGGETISSDDY